MKFIYFVFIVFSVGLDQVYSDRTNSSARRSRIRNREYYDPVPVVIVYDDSANQKKEAVSSTEGKLAIIPSTTEAIVEPTTETTDLRNKIETATDKILLPDVPIVPKNFNKKQRSNRRNGYEVPVAVVYDSATETHTRQKLEAVTVTDNPVTVRNIRQRGRKRYRDYQDNEVQQSDKEVKLTARVLKEATINPIESNSLSKETVKTKTVVRRRRPSTEGLKVVDTTQPTIAVEPKKILKLSENVASHLKEPVLYENFKLNPTEPVLEVTTSLFDDSLRDEQIFLAKSDPKIQKNKLAFIRRRPSEKDLNVVKTTQNFLFDEPTVTENIYSENNKPATNENVKPDRVFEVTTSNIVESLQDEQISVAPTKSDPIIQEKKQTVIRRKPSKEDLNIVITTQRSLPNKPTVTENILNVSKNNKPVVNENVKPDLVLEVTTSSIDESLQDEQILISSIKNNPIVLEEMPNKLQQRTKTRGPVTSTVRQNLSYPTKPVIEMTTSSIDKSLQDESILPRNDPTTQKDNRNKDQRRTKIRGPVVPIVNSQNVAYQNGEFHYSFEGGDGTKKFENGILKPFNDDVTGEAVEGGFSYKDMDGQSFSLTYTADENGYRPAGAHLPTPPPIPPAIARALRYLATKPTPAEYDDVTEKLEPENV